MAHIMTVLGPITPQDLGLTSMHEHVLFDGSLFRQRYEKETPLEVRGAFESRLPRDVRDNWETPLRLENYSAHLANYALSRDNLVNDDEEMMAGELTDFKSSGGSALLDVSSIGLRSNIPGLKRVSQRSGVHIITSTGFYTEDFWPEEYREFSADQFRARMVREIQEGIPESDVRAGHIKLAITDITAAQERMLRGGALAALETGAAISIHPGFGIGSDGRRIARILMEEGQPPGRIIISHADAFMVEHDLRRLVTDPQSWGLNLDYHHALLDAGVNLSIDCFGHRWYLELADIQVEHDWQRLAGLVALIKEGYSSQIVLGTDTFLKILTRRGGGEGYCHLTRFVIPTLRKLEVSDYDIRQMMVETPARLLTI